MSDTHAIIVGGSLAGLCAARVLSDAADRVTVLDRDRYPSEPVGRPGVPQGRHLHALLSRGCAELERLFPGFGKAMADAGALEIDLDGDFVRLLRAGWVRPRPSGYRWLFASRPLTESIVRAACRRLPNVTIVDDTAVEALHVRDGRVAGVTTRSGARLAADLVVDASGRSTHAPQWLRAEGIAPPSETVVDPHAGYSTRWFQGPPPERWPRDWWWKGVWIEDRNRASDFMGILVPIEQGRWGVILIGVGGNYPPADEDGFMAALDGLRSPLLADAVRLATPISPVYCARKFQNRLRHYETWRGPAGFLAIGDAVCAFNPIYGQGMSAAAVCANLLGATMARTGPTHPSLPQRFFRTQARFLRSPWSLATGVDLQLPTTDGHRPATVHLAGRYMDAALAAAQDDAVVHRRLTEVVTLVRPVTALLDPLLAARVGWGALRHRLRGVPSDRFAARPPAWVLAPFA
ncbi:MAG TPA: FAD-dependent monooxygenase [Candidatus Binatia bacterium]|jgi:2-polyprenyl-6-methoxyphenol hydroxylase-like FAD-dependent oxidoreductase|nr:FAD-dependent monooxygenase [Candidatus Binatia bacterium]